MKEIEIGKIIVKDNVRIDYGNLEELAASIKQFGIRRPLEIFANGELIDGHRRLKAAKLAGLTKVPYFVNEKEIEKRTEQIITAIHTKSLDAIEQGRAFKEFLDNNKQEIKTAEQLAARLSKPTEYVERRLIIVDLPEEVRQAMINKKISIGHALVLARLDKKSVLPFLKEIRRQNYSVESAQAALEYCELASKLSQMDFDKSQCKGCKYNGSEQMSLFDTGSKLKDLCLNKTCFSKKVGEFVKSKRELLRPVLFEGKDEYEEPRGYIKGGSYGESEAKITPAYKTKLRKEMNAEKYLVKISPAGNINEYFKPKETKKERVKTEKNTTIDNSRKLLEKIEEFKSELMVEIGGTLTKQNSTTLNAMVLLHFMNGYSYERTDEFEKILETHAKDKMCHQEEQIFSMGSDMLDKCLHTFAKQMFEETASEDEDILEIAAKQVGFDLNKHFVMNDKYLSLHKKDDLKALATELKININGIEKNPDIIEAIKKGWKPGQVPKALAVKNG